MRKFLIIFIALYALINGICSSAAKKSIMDLPPFERAILIIKHFETLHDLRHLPYCGYGHRIWPGEKIPKHRALTEKEADLLLRKDLKKFISIFKDLPEHDAILMGVLSYNIGPGAVKKSSVYRKLKSGDRDIFKSYISHCKYKGKFHKGLYKRRKAEFAALFIR